MRPLRRPGFRLLVASMLAVLIGCASANVTEIDTPMENTSIVRPDRIFVFDFTADPSEIPPQSALAGQIAPPSTPPTQEEMETARHLGAAVARELISEIQAMGLNAVAPEDQPPMRVGDAAFRGYFLSVDEGSALKRIAIGFGSGSAELKTMVEGFLMTEQGIRRVGGGEIDSGGGKGPGMAVPLVVTLATANPIGLAVGGAVKLATEASGVDKINAAGKRTAQEIAKELRPRFERRGWIE